MKENELKSLIMASAWRYLASGGYHDVYCSTEPLTIDGMERLWVLKIPKISEDIDEKISSISRIKPILDQINPEDPTFHIVGDDNDRLSVVTTSSDGSIHKDTVSIKECLILPYFGNVQPTPHEIANEVIELYKKTRIIIVDAEVPGNFLKYDDRIVCVDVDHAYQRDSSISKDNIDEWYDNASSYYSDEPTHAVEALLYLEENLKPNEIDDKFLSLGFLKKLHALREECMPITRKTLDILFQVMELSNHRLINDKNITPALIANLEKQANFETDITRNWVKRMLQKQFTPADKLGTRTKVPYCSFYNPENTSGMKRNREEETRDQRTKLPPFSDLEAYIYGP
ncbi:MAG: hypothetical protein K0U37_09850 [Gammaproteobacteria bacterium]|nr:hypothetical protein [Gammaproteobacteria bacterium]